MSVAIRLSLTPHWFSVRGVQDGREPLEELEEYGLDDRVRALVGAHDRVVGRVTRVDRGTCTVVGAAGDGRVSVAGDLKEQPPEARPAIGDWVMLDGSMVVEVLPRRSAFRRGDAERMQAQVVAANVDVVFVVQPATAELNLRRLERELALAWESGAIPVVVLAKADLATDLRVTCEQVAASAPGVDVIVTSAYDGTGVDELARLARPHRTVACIGASGVGKSSLVNAMLGEDVQSTTAIRESDGRGRHTTVRRELFVLPGGGVVIDTPGLRAIGMWQSDEGISRAFADIEELAAACRFSDCRHDVEPGCAVQDAVRAGSVAPERVRNYRTMLAELDALDTAAEQRSRKGKVRR